jgi:hypothetical protein
MLCLIVNAVMNYGVIIHKVMVNAMVVTIKSLAEKKISYHGFPRLRIELEYEDRDCTC